MCSTFQSIRKQLNYNIFVLLSEKYGTMSIFSSKAIQFYLTFSAEEKRVFKKFIHSPVHNPNRTLSRFYDFFDSKKTLNVQILKKEKVFAAVFPEQVFEDILLRRTLSDFFSILEDFTVWYRLQKEGVRQQLTLAKYCRERQLPDLAKTYLTAADAAIEYLPNRNAWFHLEKYTAHEERFRQRDTRTGSLNIQAMADELSDFFGAEMLRMACAAASHSAVYKTAYSLPFLEAILTNFEQAQAMRPPLVRLYYTSYLCLTDTARTDKFLELKALLAEAADWLDTQELGEVFIYAINFCIRRLNMGDADFFREVFDLYKIGLERSVFLENGHLSRFTYKNIVSAALKLGERDWVRDFIGQYTPLLAETYRHSYCNFCLARYYYDCRDFEKAEPLLQNLQSNDVFLELDGRVLLLKIWFDRGEWRLLQAFFKTFAQFVSRKKMLAYHLDIYKNILHFAQKLALWQSGAKHCSAMELAQFQQEIATARPLTEKDWLLGIVEKIRP